MKKNKELFLVISGKVWVLACVYEGLRIHVHEHMHTGHVSINNLWTCPEVIKVERRHFDDHSNDVFLWPVCVPLLNLYKLVDLSHIMKQMFALGRPSNNERDLIQLWFIDGLICVQKFANIILSFLSWCFSKLMSPRLLLKCRFWLRAMDGVLELFWGWDYSVSWWSWELPESIHVFKFVELATSWPGFARLSIS